MTIRLVLADDHPLRLGVRGMVLKEMAPEMLVRCVRVQLTLLESSDDYEVNLTIGRRI
jgi:DNA-binding NarL/FixJ family response regulator